MIFFVSSGQMRVRLDKKKLCRPITGATAPKSSLGVGRRGNKKFNPVEGHQASKLQPLP